MLVCVYTCQNITSLKFTYRGLLVLMYVCEQPEPMFLDNAIQPGNHQVSISFQ